MSTIFPRILCSCYWRVVLRNYDLGARYTHYYWGVITSGPTQKIELGNVCMCTNPCVHRFPHLFMHQSLCMCVCIYIYIICITCIWIICNTHKCVYTPKQNVSSSCYLTTVQHHKVHSSLSFPSLTLLSPTVRKFALIIYNEFIYATLIYM